MDATILTIEQRKFLEKVRIMHYDNNCTFKHRWPMLIDDVLLVGEYRYYNQSCLNEVGNTYKEWKQKTHN